MALPVQIRNHFIPLTDDEGEECRRLFDRNENVRAAFETIVRHLFGGGVFVGKKGYQLSAKDELMFNSIWIQFGIHYLMSMYIYGYAICNETEDGQPAVIWPHTVYRSLWITPDGRRIWYVAPKQGAILSSVKINEMPLSVSAGGSQLPYANEQNGPRVEFRNVYIFEMHQPTTETNLTSIRLTSILRSIVRSSAYTEKMIDCAVRAAAKQANPPMYTVTVERNVNTAQIQNDYNVMGRSQQYNIEAKDARDEDFRYSQEQHQEWVKEFNQALESANNDYLETDRDPITGLVRYPTWKGNLPYRTPIIPLPEGRTIAGGPIAQGPPDMDLVFTAEERAIGKATGVPPQLWGGSYSSAQAVNQTIMNTFYATISRHRGIVIIPFRLYIDLIFGEGEMQQTVNSWEESMDVLEHISSNEIMVSIPGQVDPLVTNMLYDKGAINEDTYIQLTSTYTGIPVEMFDKKRMALMFELQLKALEMQSVPPPPGEGKGPAFKSSIKLAGGSGGDSKSTFKSLRMEHRQPELDKYGTAGMHNSSQALEARVNRPPPTRGGVGKDGRSATGNKTSNRRER